MSRTTRLITQAAFRRLTAIHPVYLLSLFIACSGSYYGIDGPSVISRDEALQRINDARLVKVAQCGLNETNGAYLYIQFTENPRKILDGAYYSTKDVDSCTNMILWGSCEAAAQPCGLAPAEFFDGSLFQGGF
ncbi:MAG: hypothetical protein RH862_10070 [Leptospiraceae bacterium]